MTKATATPAISATLAGVQQTKLVLLRLLLRGSATADALAVAAGVHRTVVRRHMVDLLGSGLASARPMRGARGRPRTSYQITTAGREVFFARYDTLLDCLTRALVAQAGIGRTRPLFEQTAKNLAADLGFPGSKETVLQALREVGFEPELRQNHGKGMLISHNCPVLQLAQKYPALLCEAFHAFLLREAFPGVKVQLRQTMALDAPHCVHTLTDN